MLNAWKKLPITNEDNVDFIMDHASLSKEAPFVKLVDIDDDKGIVYVQMDCNVEWVDDK